MAHMDLSPITNRRTVLAGLGLAGLGLGLAGCGSPNAPSGDADSLTREGFSQAAMPKVPEKYQGRTNVLAWFPWTGGSLEAVERLLTKFNDSQEEIFAVCESQGGFVPANQKLTAALQAKAVPDVVAFSDVKWLQYYFAEALSPLDRFFDDTWSLDVYVQNFVDEGVAAGETYVVPFARSTPLFYYNKTAYEKAGLPAEGPRTWDELAEFAPALKEIEVSGKPLMPFAFGPEDNWFGQAQAWAWGGGFSDGLTVTINDEPIHNWLNWQAKFIHDDDFGYMAQEAGTDFMAGVVAGCHGSTGSLLGFESGVDFDLGAAFLLGKVEDSTKVPTGGGGLSIIKSESEERQNAAAELLKFLAEPENAATWHVDTGYLPIVNEALESEKVLKSREENPNLGVAIDQLANAQTADEAGWYDKATVAVAAAQARVYGDNADVSEVLDELETIMNEVVEDHRDELEEVMSD